MENKQELYRRIEDLYRRLVRMKYGDHSDLGVFILDVDKTSNILYEIMLLAEKVKNDE